MITYVDFHPKNTVMGKTLILFLLLLSAWPARAQTGFPHYYEYVALLTRADSLNSAGIYSGAAACYSQAIGVKVEKGFPVPLASLHYAAACSWSHAAMADSAFSHLDGAAASGYSDQDHLLRDPGLASLHADKRWPGLVAQVAAIAARKEKIGKLYAERTRFAGDSNETIFLPLHDNIKQLIQADSLPFISVNYQNFRLYFRGDSYAAQHLDELKPQLPAALKRVLETLDATEYHTGINLVLADSRDELKEVTGIAALGGMAMPGDNTLFLVFNGKRRLQAKHELFHLVSDDVWGYTASRLLDEGGAVFADNECYCSDPIFGISAWFKASGKLFTFDALIHDFDREAVKSDVIAYLESAAIFKFLYEQYGIPKLRRLRSEGFDNFEKIYGFPIERLEKDWNERISHTKVPQDVDWVRLLQEGCG